MKHSKIKAPNDTAAKQAAEWFVNLQADKDSQPNQEAFSDWLRRSPVHVEEFLQYTALYGDISTLPDLEKIDVEALLSISSNGASNLIKLDLDSPSVFENFRSRKSSRFKLIAGMTAALAAAAGIALFTPVFNFFGAERYNTAVGEQRSLTLADGSYVQLNVRSSLTAKVSATAREIRLEDGEALFEVAKDPKRPFRVRTPDAIIEAIGTQFNVYVKNGTTAVALLEGSISVHPSKDKAPITLKPGEKIIVAAGRHILNKPQIADIKTVTAWTERRLVFEDAPLSEVVDEFNRYSRQPLAIEDRALQDIRITASFDSGSAQTFADTLAAAGRLRVTRKPDGTWLIER